MSTPEDPRFANAENPFLKFPEDYQRQLANTMQPITLGIGTPGVDGRLPQHESLQNQALSLPSGQVLVMQRLHRLRRRLIDVVRAYTVTEIREPRQDESPRFELVEDAIRRDIDDIEKLIEALEKSNG